MERQSFTQKAQGQPKDVVVVTGVNLLMGIQHCAGEGAHGCPMQNSAAELRRQLEKPS